MLNFKRSNGYTFCYNIPKFINHYKCNNVVSLNYDSSSSNGASTDLSLYKSMLGSIGESYERQTLQLINSKNMSSVKTMNILDNKLINIDFSGDNFSYLFDTCALSTHTSTDKCIENSFSEFIERQSFILSYLSKSNSREIVKNSYFMSIVPKEFHFLDFYEISFVNNYKVVFCIGQRINDTVDIGLGAGYTIKEALNTVMKEVKPFNNYKHNKIIDNDHYLDYIDIFNMLPVSSILNAYKFLNTGVKYYPKPETKCSMKKVLVNLKINYDMDVVMLSLFSKNHCFFRNKYSKNIKIMSLGWFPSLNVSDYKDSIYLNVENKTGLSLDRTINFIPFP